MTMADVMITVDTPFRDYIFQQTVARINRLGVTTQTHVYVAQLDTGEIPNISQRTTDILKWSAEQVSLITGYTVPFELNDEMIALEDYSSII